MKTALVEREIMALFASLGTSIFDVLLCCLTRLKYADKKGDGVIYFDSFIASIRVRRGLAVDSVVHLCL